MSGLFGGGSRIERFMEQGFIHPPKFAEGELVAAEPGGQRGGDHEVAHERDGLEHDVLVVKLQAVGASQHIDNRSKLHVADMADLGIGVQGHVAVVAHDGHVGHRDGATATRVAIGVAKGPHLMQIVLGEGEIGFALQHA